jgi:hypothetical protein
MKSIEQGVREAAQAGILAGHEMTDLRATLIGGSAHDTDSNHAAFQIAASIAFKDAAKKARPVALEPIMSVQFTISDRQRDQLLREIRARRGRTVTMDHKEGPLIVWITRRARSSSARPFHCAACWISIVSALPQCIWQATSRHRGLLIPAARRSAHRCAGRPIHRPEPVLRSQSRVRRSLYLDPSVYSPICIFGSVRRPPHADRISHFLHSQETLLPLSPVH